MAAGRVSCQLPAPGAQLRWPTTGNWPRRPIQHRGVPGWPRSSNMAEAITVSAPISGTDKTLSFETGKLAFQSQGAVIARIAGTEALVTANAAKGIREGIAFSPLTLAVAEGSYAARRIPAPFSMLHGPTHPAHTPA